MEEELLKMEQQRVKYCEIDDIVYGNWTVNRDFEDYDDIFKAYGLQSSASTSCDLPPSPDDPNQSLSSDEERRFNRVKEIAIPTLQPRGGCIPHVMDSKMMLKRLLRSPAGLTIVGDSISQYTFQVWVDTLQSIDKGLLTKIKINDFFYTLNINANHELTETILSSTGISRDRFSFPVISFYRSDLLISPDQVRGVMTTTSLNKLKIKLGKNAPDWFPLWVKLLKDSNELISTVDSVSSPYTEPNLLVLNSGAHWNRGTLGEDIEQEEFVVGYRNMFLGLSKEITQLPFPVAAYWRSLAPAHVDCVVSTTFDNTRLDGSSPINGRIDQWN